MTTEEITAEFIAESHRFANPDGDVIVGTAHANGSINGPIAIKGPAEIDELLRHQTYRFYGRWSDYKNRRTGVTEKQFHFQTFTLAAPHSKTGVVEYLKRAGVGLGFGQARALALWQAFGTSAVQVMRIEPHRALNVLATKNLRLSFAEGQQISAILKNQQALENYTIELTERLAGSGLPKTTPKKCIQEWGSDATRVVDHHPHRLMRFPRCGFKLCDQLYLKLGLPSGRLKRQALAAWYAIESNSDGHVWFPRTVAETGIRGGIAGAELRIDRAIELAVRAGLLRSIKTIGPNGTISDSGNCEWLALREAADMEATLAELVADATTESYQWPAIGEIKNIDQQQPEVLSQALRGPVCILTGRPGSGKTFAAANVIAAAMEMFGEHEIGIGVPTNLAAQRLTEALAGYGINLRARTWHSLLGVPTREQVGEKWRHNAKNPFPYNLLVGDEMSMVDLEIATAVFHARPKGTQVFLVGDIRQLLPVSPGAPLRDLIDAGLPCGELTEIRRNSGGIVEACSAIADGKPWGGGDNLEIIEIDDPEQQKFEVVRQMKLAQQAGLDPIWDTRVIVARNVVRQEINQVLQAELNPNPAITGSPFRVGDKVICRDNKEFTIVEADTSDEGVEVNDRGDSVKVFNGELGAVLEVHEKHFVIRIKSPSRVVRVPRGKSEEASDERKDKTGTGCAFDLAYAITYHSSQGSEFPWCIMLASTRDGRMGSRELVYTGISRAQLKCKMIGRKPVWDSMCRRVALRQRKTLLKERVLLNLAERKLANI